MIGENKHQIRTLVDEIVQLAEAGLTAQQFYRGFLPRVVTASAAHGGAIWTLDSHGQLQRQFQINLQTTQLRENDAAQLKHARTLQHVVTNGAPLLVPPDSCLDDPESGNPTDFLLVLAPLKQAGEVVGVVEIFQRPEAGPPTQEGCLHFLQQMCEVAASASFHSQQSASDPATDGEEICTTQMDPYPSWSKEEVCTTSQRPYASWNEEQRTWWVIGGCLLFFSLNNVAVAPVMEVISQNDPAAFVVYMSMAVIGAQMALQAVWCVFAPYRLTGRITGAVVMVTVLPTAWILGVLLAETMYNFADVDWYAIRALMCLPLLAVAIQSPLWAAKCVLGWRVVAPWHYLEEMPDRKFGIRDLLIAMAIGAAVLSAAQLGASPNSSVEEFLVPVAISAVVLALVSLVTTIPVFIATMRPKRIGWPLVLLLFYGAVLTFATIVAFVFVTQRNTGAIVAGLATMAYGFFVSLTACMLLFRALGWRLQLSR
jgi:GAF domain-containing protein